MSKISNLTVVNQEGTMTFYVGTTYHGLLLSRIIDNSIDYGNSLYCSIFQGMAEDEQLVFEVINAPIIVNYSAEEN